jgi:hypothetical protein
VEEYGRYRQAKMTIYIQRMGLHAGRFRLQTNTQNIKYLLLFHVKCSCANAPQCYVICTLSLFFHYSFTDLISLSLGLLLFNIFISVNNQNLL